MFCIGLEGESRLGHSPYFVEQPRVAKSIDGNLVFPSTRAIPHDTIHKLPLFSRKLGWNRIPHRPNARHDAAGRIFGEIAFVGIKKICLDLPYIHEVPKTKDTQMSND